MSRILCEISFLQYVARPWTAFKTSMKNDGAKNLDKIPSAAFIIIGLKRRFETFDKWLKKSYTIFGLSTPWPVFLVSKTFKELHQAPPYKEKLPRRLQFCNICKESYLPPFPPISAYFWQGRKGWECWEMECLRENNKRKLRRRPCPALQKKPIGETPRERRPRKLGTAKKKNFKDNFGCDRWAFSLRMPQLPHVQGDFGINSRGDRSAKSFRNSLSSL